ncbi:MAG: DNA cytosine methyltransferase [Candidatus Brocadiae bacterium]|nr:DNA cytosine methyltransferase [Candidatus Brocadiia bacterium]
MQLLLFEKEDFISDYFSQMMEYFNIRQSCYIDRFGEAVYNWAKMNVKPIHLISIFSGAGGLDIGFRDAGFKIISHLEIESDFCQTLELNKEYFGHSEIIHKDIREFYPENKQCDFIIGGPPCQTFSAAGRRAAGVQGIEDNRGTLFEEYVRLLKYYKPQGFLFENVYGITGAQSGQAWQMIKEEFAEAGYKIHYRILNTADYGVPQFRERMIVIGAKEDYFFPRPTHGPDSKTQRDYYSSEIALVNAPIHEDIAKLTLNGRHGHLLNDIPPGLNYSFYTEKLGHPNPIFAWRSKFSDYLYKADPKKPVRTIKAQGGQYTGPLHWDNRYFTVDEYKRLQSFPDSYKIFGNRQRAIHQIGNSVPPQFARIMALSILNQIFHVRLPFDLDYLKNTEELTFRKKKREITKENIEIAKKANDGIQKIKPFQLKEPYSFNISVDEFFKINLDSNRYITTVYDRDDELVLRTIKNDKNELLKFKIILEPASEKSWCFIYKKIILESNDDDIWGYTTSWKAFDSFLKANNLKDDIVQLNGYYQYRPQIHIKLDLLENELDKIFSIVKKIIDIKPVRKIMTYSDFADKMDIPADSILHVLKLLKSIGYEVRNHNTNPQIKSDSLLIPYLFPTLTNLSIQLRKEL